QAMNHLDIVRGFQEYCDSGSHSPAQLAAQLLKRIEPLGFRHFACCSHVDPSDPPPETVMLHNYPEAWVRTFSEARLYEIDPVLRRAGSSRVPFFWDTAFACDRLSGPQRRVLAEAAGYGLIHGYTIPLQASWLPGTLRVSFSVIPDSDRIDPTSYVTVELLAKYLYLFSARTHELGFGAARIELSVRERQCLDLVAQGKTDWEAAQILGLSKSTVHTYVESAKGKLGVATRQQAAMYALTTGQISSRRSSVKISGARTPALYPARSAVEGLAQNGRFREC
ncbi:MAG: LuxR family transcriptional regulator, partial [Terriglobia bacterium]|nr:LuxR family transcriptional regulator [Terriglobia bacterium]